MLPEQGGKGVDVIAYALFSMCVLAPVFVFIWLPSVLPNWLMRPTPIFWINFGVGLLIQGGGFLITFMVLFAGWRAIFSRLLPPEQFQEIVRQLRTDWSEDGT